MKTFSASIEIGTDIFEINYQNDSKYLTIIINGDIQELEINDPKAQGYLEKFGMGLKELVEKLNSQTFSGV